MVAASDLHAIEFRALSVAAPWSQEVLQFEIAKGVNSVNMINDILCSIDVGDGGW